MRKVQRLCTKPLKVNTYGEDIVQTQTTICRLVKTS